MALKEYTNPVGVYNNNYSSGLTTAHIDNTANVYTEEFKAFLQQVQASYPTTVRQIPLDEPRIQVNLNTRIIDIENSEYADFLIWLLTYDGEFYAGASERYPQFMVSDSELTLSSF